MLGCGLAIWTARRRLPVTWCGALLCAAAGVIAWHYRFGPAVFTWPVVAGPLVIGLATSSYLRAVGAVATLLPAGVLWVWPADVPSGFGAALLIGAAIEAAPPLRRAQPA